MLDNARGTCAPGGGAIGSSEEELVRDALEGSHAAFAELVGRYRDGLFRYLLLRCATVSDAEDALQDTLVNAWRYLASYDARWRFSTWLYRIALREAARARPAALHGAGYFGNSDNPGDHAGGPDPLAECIDRDARVNLWLTAKRTLTAEAYTAMWLHYVEDLPLAEVSTALDRSRSWTKVTLMRSRHRLKKQYDEERARRGNRTTRKEHR